MHSVSVIGPTNIGKLSAILQRSREDLLREGAEVGAAIAASGSRLLVNSDGGMLEAVARSYKEKGGASLVILAPGRPHPWPLDHTLSYRDIGDEVRTEDSWFDTNYRVVTDPDVCVCVGLSAGTLSELAYIKWNRQFRMLGNLKKLVVVQSLVRGGNVPPEILEDIRELVHTAPTPADLLPLLS